MKLKEFIDILNEKSIDACILLKSNMNKNDSNITYFSGLDLNDFCCLIIYRNKDPLLIVPKLELIKSKKFSFIKNIIPLEDLWVQLKKEIKAKKIGLNFDCISIREYERFKRIFPKARFLNISKELDKIRRIKTTEEIKKLKEACKISDEIIEKCISNFKKFKTESEVANFIDGEIRKLGLINSFSTIVASGKNASIPHHLTSKRKLQKGFCVIDFGVKFENYCSDITRTLYIGKPSKKEKEVYSIVLKSQKESIKMAKPGIKASEVDKFCRKMLGIYEKYFIHGLGHQIGIDVHEGSFRLSTLSKDILQKGMVFTIEPGIYIENKFGIRIEDTVLLQEKCIPLNKFTKELIAINL